MGKTLHFARGLSRKLDSHGVWPPISKWTEQGRDTVLFQSFPDTCFSPALFFAATLTFSPFFPRRLIRLDTFLGSEMAVYFAAQSPFDEAITFGHFERNVPPPRSPFFQRTNSGKRARTQFRQQAPRVKETPEATNESTMGGTTVHFSRGLHSGL